MRQVLEPFHSVDSVVPKDNTESLLHLSLESELCQKNNTTYVIIVDIQILNNRTNN